MFIKPIPTDTETQEINPMPAKRVRMTYHQLVKHVEVLRDSKTLVSNFKITLLPAERNGFYSSSWTIELNKHNEVVLSGQNKFVQLTENSQLSTDWQKNLMGFWFSTVSGLEQLKKIYLIAKSEYPTDVHVTFEQALPKMVQYCEKDSEPVTLKNNASEAMNMCTSAVFGVVNPQRRTAEGTKAAILQVLQGRKAKTGEYEQPHTNDIMLLRAVPENYDPLVTEKETSFLLTELELEGKIKDLGYGYWEAV